VFCLLVVLAKLSVLVKCLARKIPLRKPNRVDGIVSRKPRPKSACDFLGLLYCFIVLLCVLCCLPALRDIFPTSMARYSLLVLKVPLNTKQANKQTNLARSGVRQSTTSRPLVFYAWTVNCCRRQRNDATSATIATERRPNNVHVLSVTGTRQMLLRELRT